MADAAHHLEVGTFEGDLDRLTVRQLETARETCPGEMDTSSTSTMTPSGIGHGVSNHRQRLAWMYTPCCRLMKRSKLLGPPMMRRLRTSRKEARDLRDDGMSMSLARTMSCSHYVTERV